MPKLTATAGPDAGGVFALDGPAIVVGRHSGAGVRLADTRVSRRHFELRSQGDSYRLVDLGSGNGTRVNGVAVQSADLRPGDRVEVGDTVLVYASGGTPRDAPTVVVRAGPDASGVVRTLEADAAPGLLRAPARAGTDWLRNRLACLAALYEATDAVSEILDVDELLGRIMDLALATAGADHGVVLLADADSGELEPKAARGKGGTIVVSRSIADAVLADGRAVLLNDAAADDRFGDRESVARHNLREVICAPMKGRHGTLGVLFLGTTAATGRFTEDHLTLAAALAHQAALAVEETRYYQALLQAERLAAVGQTMAALSHHVKNIMQGVQFGGDLVRLGLAQDDKPLLAQGWKLVERNQARIDELILDMLNYSKERPPGIEPTSLAEIAADVVELVRGRAAESGVEVRLEPGDLPPIACDPEGLHRALLNVVSNAVDAAEEGDPKRVTVNLNLADGRAEIAVTDTGPGIDPTRAEELFKPFVSTKGSSGTGLGLPVSRKILREHGGDLTAEALPEGGSRFVLRLPAG